MWTKKFFADLGERGIKTFVQALVATMAVGMPADLLDWKQAVVLALTAAGASVLSSFGSAYAGQPGTASLVAPQAVDPGRHGQDAE